MDPKLIQEALDALIADDAPKALELLKTLVASAAGAETSEPEADPSASTPDPAQAAAAATLCKLTGRKSIGEAVAAVEKAFATLRKAEADQAALDETSRAELVGRLVVVGAEVPATAWEGDAKDRKPVERLRAEPVASLRARVESLEAAKGIRKPVEAPTRNDAQLSAEDQAAADKIKDPAQRERFINIKLQRAARRAS